jgi:REP element-mobilizing transposase RayT
MSHHHAFQMYAHVTWHTWERVGCVDARTARDVRKAALVAATRARIRILRLAVLADHVHVVLSFRPDTKVSDFVRVAKSGSAVMANRRVPGQLKWARGYYVATIHRDDLTGRIGYVAGQDQRHPERVPREGVH